MKEYAPSVLHESVEVRWFLSEEDPRVLSLRRWFEDVKVEGERHDYYVPTARADLGIKVRDEKEQAPKLETKFLVKDEGERTFGANLKGRFQRWKKVSMELADFSRSDRASLTRVGKERQLRKFAFDEGQAKPVSILDRPESGCGFELTRIDVDGKVSFSIGLEAFGDDREAAFEATAKIVFAERPDLVLAVADSLSYPAWLSRP